MTGNDWKKGFKDYISANSDNQYTDDLSVDDQLVIFKDRAGAGEYDRPTTISELVAIIQATIVTGLHNMQFIGLDGKANEVSIVGYAVSVVVATLKTGTSGSFIVGFSDGDDTIVRSYELTALSKPYVILSVPRIESTSPTVADTIYVETTGVCTMDIYVSNVKFI